METRKSFPDKKEIRKKHLAIRNAMSEPETAEKSRAICEKLLTSDWYAITDWIFGYYPLGKEADCLEFLKKALSDGRHVALPRTGAEVGGLQLKKQYKYGKVLLWKYVRPMADAAEEEGEA